jgi:hypothetical protein
VAQIRLYKPEERKELRATGAHAAWEAAFRRYLEEQGCPLQPQPDNRAAVLDWLLQQAVSFEYRDRGTRRLRTRTRARTNARVCLTLPGRAAYCWLSG